MCSLGFAEGGVQGSVNGRDWLGVECPTSILLYISAADSGVGWRGGAHPKGTHLLRG